MFRICLFAAGLISILFGVALGLDVFIPKSKPVPGSTLLTEFLIGMVFFAIGVWSIRRSRLRK